MVWLSVAKAVTSFPSGTFFQGIVVGQLELVLCFITPSRPHEEDGWVTIEYFVVCASQLSQL